MKYFSEVLNKTFDSVSELETEEKRFEAQKAKEIEEAHKKEDTKKKLVQAIEQEEKNVDSAYDELESAREKCKVILEESNKKVETILTEAKEKVRVAEQKRLNAIREYNKLYGTYKVYYDNLKTDADRARVERQVNSLFDLFDFFRF